MDDRRVGVGGNESSEHMRQKRSKRWPWQCEGMLIHTWVMHGAKLSTRGQTRGKSPKMVDCMMDDAPMNIQPPVENRNPHMSELLDPPLLKHISVWWMEWYVESLTHISSSQDLMPLHKKIQCSNQHSVFCIWSKTGTLAEILMNRTH